MTGKQRPVEDLPKEDTPQPAPQKKDRGDPWKEPCPVCGLLGCVRHA